MKKLFIFLVFGLAILSVRSQNWAPVGATWHYTEFFFESGDIHFFKREAVKDTVYEGKSCRKITKHDLLICTDRPSVEYMYEENDRVYFYDTIFNEFQVLYDFTPVVGNSWFIKLRNYVTPPDTDTLFVTVDSIEIVTINMFALNKFYVTYDFHNEMVPNHTYSGEIIERIGDLWYMFNFAPSFGFVCDGNWSGGLRCYDDPVIGHWETGIADSCNQVVVGIEPRPSPSVPALSLFPDPVTDIVKIGGRLDGRVGYRVVSADGTLLLRGLLDPNGIRVGNLRPGLYFLSLEGLDAPFSRTLKFVKN